MNWIKVWPPMAATLLLAAGQVRAGTLDAQYLGAIEAANFVYSGNSYTMNTAKDFGTRIDSPGPGVDTLVPATFVAYCVEVDQNVYVDGRNQHHDNVVPLAGSTTTPGGPPGPPQLPVFFDPTRTLMMERLWGGFESSVFDQHTAAAFQLAIWEVAFDNDQTLSGNLSLLHATALDLATPGSTAAIAEAWLAQVRDLHVTLATQPLLLITDGTTQDLITPSTEPSFNTPEPASIALLASGAVGLALFARRKR